MPYKGKYQPFITNIGIIFTTWFFWLYLTGQDKAFSYLEKNWEITVTMIFGSIVAGATSEGGGAIAFPVFTKILHIAPYDAKVFALSIQSVGMTAASICILFNKIPIERRVLLWASMGGVFGIIIGTYIVAPLVSPNLIKMTFTVMATTFGAALIVMNKNVRRRNNRLPINMKKEKIILIASGILGGILSGLVGSGIDIVVFSVMVILFRINEKVATPTSVILMALNSIVGFVLYLSFDGFSETARSYWIASLPVVVGAPLGALICSKLSRKMIVNVLLALILVELITSILIIPLSPSIIIYSITSIIIFSFLYYRMYRIKTYDSSLLLTKGSQVIMDLQKGVS